jgi:hypothetical protein
MRDAWHVCVQPAAAVGFQARPGGGEQSHGTLWVVLLRGDCGQSLEVVGGTCFVSGFGREGQPFLSGVPPRRPGRPGLGMRPGTSSGARAELPTS